jgi:hypothetical protein
MSALPKQIQQQADELEVLERQLRGEAEPPTAQEQPVAEQPVAQDTTEQPTNVVELKQGEETWEQRFRTLQGMHQAEVPKLHAQVKELTSQLQQALTQIQQLQQPQTQQAAPVDEPLVTSKDEEAFGTDLIDVQRRVAKEVMREMVNPLKKELSERDAKIAELEKLIAKTGGDVSSMSFEQKLGQAIPDFDAINRDPKWIAWLAENDPFTNKPRKAYAEYVYGNGDISEVKHIVDLYKATLAAPDTKPNQRQTELNRQVQPTRTASSSSTPSANERFYTEVEMSRLFDKVAQLNRAQKYDEARKLEADLSEAYVQGRVRG